MDAMIRLRNVEKSYDQGSGKVFVLRLADGRFVKLVIDEYYGSGQAACNSDGTAGSNGAMLKIRRAWL